MGGRKVRASVPQAADGVKVITLPTPHRCRSMALSGIRGIEKEKVAPGPSFGSAQRRP